MDDSEYPIYDTNVCAAFGLKPPYATELNDKIRKYVESYNIIRSVSKNMIKLQADKIELFRNIFKNNEISNLRIIDLIIWKLGEKMLKGEIKIAKK